MSTGLIYDYRAKNPDLETIRRQEVGNEKGKGPERRETRKLPKYLKYGKSPKECKNRETPDHYHKGPKAESDRITGRARKGLTGTRMDISETA